MDFGTVLSAVIFLLVFLATCGLGLLLACKLERDRRRGRERLRALAVEKPAERPLLPSVMGLPARLGESLRPLLGRRAERLRRRLARAGLYSPRCLPLFLGAQGLLAGLLPLAIVVPLLTGWLSPVAALLAAFAASVVGFLAPALWLEARGSRRRAALRRGLPDALDMIVLCIEGGVSLAAALQRVAAEIESVHPELGIEMNILQREMQLGLSAGDAMKQFAERADLEELHNLAEVLLQSERFGTGVVKALRIHADTARQERQQRAEETAQKAAVKVLFPTLLFIFPSIFIVLLGPAAYQIADMMSRLK